MSHLRFNHVFAGLLLISMLCAFVISPRFTNPIRAQAQGIFFPVARPARAIAEGALGRFHRGDEVDRRADQSIRAENERLKAALASMTGELEHLQGIASDFDRLGDIAQYCTRATVSGNATGQRDSLPIQGSFASTKAKDAVLYEQSIVGRIERVGLGSAQVRLISDRGMVMRGRFRRFTDDGRGGIKFDAIESDDAIVEGNGSSTMIITNLELRGVKGIQPGDWVVLDDPDWSKHLRFRRIGVVKQIRPRAEAPLFAEILVHPQWNLLALSEVMVMDKAEGTGVRGQGSGVAATGGARDE